MAEILEVVAGHPSAQIFLSFDNNSVIGRLKGFSFGF